MSQNHLLQRKRLMLTMSVCALLGVSISGLGIGDPSLAGGAETTCSVLEVTKGVFHEGSFGGEVGRAAMEIAW